MLKDIIMPRLGDTATEGWVAEWLKSKGDEVELGETICVVSMDKAAFDLESAYDGIVEEILMQPEEIVPVGTPIARIRVEE